MNDLSNFGYLQCVSLILLPALLLIVAAVLISRINASRARRNRESQ